MQVQYLVFKHDYWDKTIFPQEPASILIQVDFMFKHIISCVVHLCASLDADARGEISSIISENTVCLCAVCTLVGCSKGLVQFTGPVDLTYCAIAS
jgi:hypothetical protein